LTWALWGAGQGGGDGLQQGGLIALDDHQVRQTIDLTGLHLTRARLGGANLTSANLTGADLTGADLGGADLTGAGLFGASLTSARLNDAVGPSEAAVPEGWEREAGGRLHRSSTSWDGQGDRNWSRLVITRCITRSPVSSAQLKVSHRELAAVGEMGVPINVGSWRVWRVIQHESCPWGCTRAR